jgi:CRP/FNR family transcriptional regulator, cyclic AMP receptor protein
MEEMNPSTPTSHSPQMTHAGQSTGHGNGSSIPRGSRQSDAAAALHDLLADPALEVRRSGVASGAVVFEPNAPARMVYFVLRGQVRLYQQDDQGNSRLCEILGADEWFGVGSLAGSETYGIRAVAVVPSVIAEVRVDKLLDAMSKQPDLLIEFNRQLAVKLQSAREEAAELIFRDTNARLVNTLLRFAHSAASTPREDGVVLNITHSQLAQAVGAARETISLALSQLRVRNLVKTGRNQLFFNPDVLRRVRGEFRSPQQPPAQHERVA